MLVRGEFEASVFSRKDIYETQIEHCSCLPHARVRVFGFRRAGSGGRFSMKTTGTFGLLLLLVAFAALLVPHAAISGKSNEEKGTLVTGTGNIIAVVTRTSEPLSPPCVTLVTRVGTASFSGLIENAPEHGLQETRALRDACEEPIQGTNRTTYTLDEATVAGRTGGLILEASGVFDGDATSPAGSRTRLHFTIRGVSGELKGATGTGQFVGDSTTTSSFNTYYAEILLPH